MLTDRHFPYSSMQEINLDWILTKVKNILRFVPDDGRVGQILRRTAHGAEWSDEQGGGGGAVNSVNGQTGDVVLDASDVGALPDTTVIPTDTSDLTNNAGFVDAAGAAAAAPVQSVNGQTGTVVLDADDVGALPDTYVAPVTSVNGQTGAVSLSIPTDTSDLTNTAGYVDAAGAAAAAPVQSVNGQTGAVVIPTGISMTLLWTNTGTGSSFGASTIPLDLTDYDYVIVMAATYPGIYPPVVMCPVGGTGRLIYVDGYQEHRPFTVATNGITFDNAKYTTTYGTSNLNTANNYLVPIKIWGVKE